MNHENPVFQSLAMIEERLQEKLTIENLAEALYLSKYHYQRLFRETVGDSVMRYVARRRLALAAQELVQHKETTILEIALKYGYDTHEGFTRSFRAYMGVTPAEYRKYHCAVSSPTVPKERCVMMYSKVTDEMLRELNALIVQAMEAADYTRKNSTAVSRDCAGYADYWGHIADQADAMAQALGEVLGRITGIARQPDAISARFVLIKTIEEAAFWANILAFETGLTAARAMPQHRVIFEPICEKYNKLSQSAQIKAEKIAQFFSELTTMIFQDLRENAQAHLDKIAEKGRAVYEGCPSGYITAEIHSVLSELARKPLEEITVRCLEDALFRVNIVLFAAGVELLRTPSDKALFERISDLKEQLMACTQYFKSLSEDFAQDSTAPQKASNMESSHRKEFCAQGKVLLFYLRGELQKLGSSCLSQEHEEELEAICAALEDCLGCAEEDTAQTGRRIQAVYDELMTAAAALGGCKGPVQYIAEQLRQLAASYKLV